MHVLVYGCVYEFWVEIILKGRECKTRSNLKNSNFAKNGKAVIFRNSPKKESGIFLDLG